MDKTLKKWIMAALMMAIICVATIALVFPTPSGGYLNIGDCFVLLSGWLLGPWYGLIASGVGSALSDVISGYAVYAPGTLLVKGLMAVIAALISRALTGKRPLGRVLSAIAAELWMVLGYFAYEWVLNGYGGAIVGVPMNLLQGLAGAAAAVLIALLLDRKNLMDHFLS